MSDAEKVPANPAGDKAPGLAQGATQLIANPTNDITIPRYNKVLRPIDETLLHRGGGKGIALYREVLKDGRAWTVLQKRKRKLAARTWSIEPASPARIDRKAAAICEAQLRALPFDQVLLGLLDATLMGFSVGETVWERDGGAIVARKLPCHDQRRFIFGEDRSLKLLTWEQMAFGVDLPPRKFIVHRFEDLSSDPYGWGLGRILFWHVLFKREGVAFWMKALERFATPLPVAKYPIGSLPDQQGKLLDAVSGMIVDGALVVPAGTEISFATAAVSGTLTHEAWCRYWDEQTAECVLGQNLTTRVTGGSMAAANTHKEVEDELIDGDGDLMAGTLKQSLLEWITLYNAPDAQVPSIKFKRPSNVRAEEEGNLARAKRQAADLANVRSMRAMGWAPDDEKAHIAEVMETAVVQVTPTPDPDPGAGGDPSGQGGDAEDFADQGDDIDHDVETVEDAGAPIFRTFVAQVRAAIRELIASGGSLSDLPDKMLALYPQMDTDRLTRLLSAAMTNAELRGRADVIDGIDG